MIGQGQRSIRAARAVCVACMLFAATHAPAADTESPPLTDGQFHTVSQPAPGTAPAAPATPSLTQPPARRGPSAPQPGAQSRSFGSSRGPQSSAPSMIGDFFGGGSVQITFLPPATPIDSH
jgi:hypothetical protein